YLFQIVAQLRIEFRFDDEASDRLAAGEQTEMPLRGAGVIAEIGTGDHAGEGDTGQSKSERQEKPFGSHSIILAACREARQRQQTPVLCGPGSGGVTRWLPPSGSRRNRRHPLPRQHRRGRICRYWSRTPAGTSHSPSGQRTSERSASAPV